MFRLLLGSFQVLIAGLLPVGKRFRVLHQLQSVFCDLAFGKILLNLLVSGMLCNFVFILVVGGLSTGHSLLQKVVVVLFLIHHFKRGVHDPVKV